MVPLLLFLQFLLIVLVPSCAQAQHNITLGSSLTPLGSSTSWLSPSGDFAFGFYPLETNSSLYLLAIWFAKIAAKTVVWYAKSDTPVLVPSGSRLHLTTNGLLSLRNASGSEVWNRAVTGVAYASMLDTGNFMLVGTDGSTKWQSFDEPTDTILPSQVLQLGKNLQARLMDTDYSDGRFVLAVQDDGNLVFYLVAVPSGNQYDPYWSTSTVGNGSRLVFNETGEIYYALTNGTQLNITDTKVDLTADNYSRATLDPDGVFRQYVHPRKAAASSGTEGWIVLGLQPENICQAIQTQIGSGACGFNSICTFSGNQSRVDCSCPMKYSFIDVERKYKGCKPDFTPQSCDLDDTTALEQFELVPKNNVDWPLADYERYNPVGEDECRQLCLTDCFCAVAVSNNGDCWKKKLPLSNGNSGDNVIRTVLLKLPRSNNSQSQLSSDSNKWKKDKKYWILGSSVLLGGSIVVNLVLTAAFLLGTYCTVHRKQKRLPQSLAGGLPLRAFTYSELKEATDEFREELGRGASSVVYKGHLQDEFSTCVAVKKIDKHMTASKQLDKPLPELEKEFAVEVQTIGRTFHKNLVRLLGFCSEGTERLLVYEFMSNGSLTKFLFSDVRPHWNLRVQVALGVARGLLYLHERCSTQIIHCDIKPQNILLDDNLVAKISDFGLAKLLRTDQTQTTTAIRGTRGYVAPEWFKNIGITAKVDVYSFGVILLELVCCRRNVEPNIADEDQTILTYWANDCYRHGRLDLLVEGDEEAVLDLKRVERFVAVALWCVLEEPAMRPTMLKVTQMLDGAVEIPAPPDLSSYISSIQ